MTDKADYSQVAEILVGKATSGRGHAQVMLINGRDSVHDLGVSTCSHSSWLY